MTKKELKLTETNLLRETRSSDWRCYAPCSLGAGLSMGPRRLLLPGLLTGLLTGLLIGLASCSPTDAPTANEPTANTTPSEESSPAIRLPSIRLSGRSVVPTASLMADSDGKTVAVSGTVAKKVSVLESWLYQIQDDSGSVWVLSAGSDPEVGEVATVEGVVRFEAIVVDEIDAGEVYLEERAYQSGAR